MLLVLFPPILTIISGIISASWLRNDLSIYFAALSRYGTLNVATVLFFLALSITESTFSAGKAVREKKLTGGPFVFYFLQLECEHLWTGLQKRRVLAPLPRKPTFDTKVLRVGEVVEF